MQKLWKDLCSCWKRMSLSFGMTNPTIVWCSQMRINSLYVNPSTLLHEGLYTLPCRIHFHHRNGIGSRGWWWWRTRHLLSKCLAGSEILYSHVEKLALEALIIVQRFRHYILLRKTSIIANSNPMYHILTRQVLGGKYSRWIIILQEFDLEFAK